MTSLQIGLVSSIYTLGGLFGALIAGPLSVNYGRVPPMRAMTFVALLGAVSEALAPSITVMALGRVIAGIAAGASTVIVPLYISEIAPPGQKGFFGAFTQITTNGGIFITQLLGYFLSYGQMWRWILAAAGIVAVGQFVALLGAVESPKWNANHNKGRQAKIDLQRIRGRDADLKDEMESWKSSDGDLSNGEAVFVCVPDYLACILTFLFEQRSRRLCLQLLITLALRVR
jgi:MFS family permease